MVSILLQHIQNAFSKAHRKCVQHIAADKCTKCQATRYIFHVFAIVLRQSRRRRDDEKHKRATINYMRVESATFNYTFKKANCNLVWSFVTVMTYFVHCCLCPRDRSGELRDIRLVFCEGV